MNRALISRLLRRATEILGSKEELRDRLQVPMRHLSAWLSGTAEMPAAVFLRAVDIVAEASQSRNCEDRSGILVVDDDRDSASMLMALLRDEGHEVRAAYTGSSALLAADRFKPGAVLLDIVLPDMSGWDVARKLAREERGTPPLLIGISGVYTQGAEKVHAETAGFRHFVTKPYDPHALLALLEPLR